MKITLAVLLCVALAIPAMAGSVSLEIGNNQSVGAAVYPFQDFFGIGARQEHYWQDDTHHYLNEWQVRVQPVHGDISIEAGYLSGQWRQRAYATSEHNPPPVETTESYTGYLAGIDVALTESLTLGATGYFYEDETVYAVAFGARW